MAPIFDYLVIPFWYLKQVFGRIIQVGRNWPEGYPIGGFWHIFLYVSHMYTYICMYVYAQLPGFQLLTVGRVSDVLLHMLTM